MPQANGLRERQPSGLLVTRLEDPNCAILAHDEVLLECNLYDSRPLKMYYPPKSVLQTPICSGSVSVRLGVASPSDMLVSNVYVCEIKQE